MCFVANSITLRQLTQIEESRAMWAFLLIAFVGVCTASYPSFAHNHSHWKGHEYPHGHRNYGLSVPFYLYSGGGFDAFTSACKRTLFSKGVEVSWLNRLGRHPWRVTDPDDAVVFVVPGLFSLPFQNATECSRSVESMSDELLLALRASPYFHQSDARDHVLVVGYFKGESFLRHDKGWAKALANMTIAPHVNGYRVRNVKCVVPAGHQAPTAHVPIAPPVITHTLFFMGQAVGPAYYATRRAVLAPGAMKGVGENNHLVADQCSRGGVNGSYPICGSLEAMQLDNPNVGCCLEKELSYESYIEMFKGSNFSLNFRGGDAGSSRTFDAIAMGVPQIIIADRFFADYAPFQCTVPWRNFVHQVESEKALLRDTK